MSPLPLRVVLAATLLLSTSLLQGCWSDSPPAPHLVSSQRHTTTAHDCRHLTWGTPGIGETPTPDPTRRTCDCLDAPTIKTAADIEKVGQHYLSTRNWDDAYSCSGALHVIYGDIGVTFQDRPDLKARSKAVSLTRAMANRWGGKATQLSGYPVYEEDPRTSKQPVGAIVMIVVRGTLVSLQGNRDASLADAVALAKTLQF